MKTSALILASSLAATASAAAWTQSQVDRAFSATGSSCDQVTWSQNSLAKYPHIGSACQAVLQRDGKYFVKFEGDVKRVAARGRELTVNFKGGSAITLQPPDGMKVHINGKPTAVSGLRPGDKLNFYIPQDHLAANFAAEDSTPETVDVPIAPAPEEAVAASPALPHTASVFPTIGLLGFLLLSCGALLTLQRSRRARS
jgi:hypothetical protein